MNQQSNQSKVAALPSTSRACHLGSDWLSERPDREQSGVSRCSTSSRRISNTDSLQSRRCTTSSLSARQSYENKYHNTRESDTPDTQPQQYFSCIHSPTSKGLVMKTAWGATPNMSWWCQASGTSSPCGAASCMFMVATGTAPFRIQRASQGTSLTRRGGWRWKNRPITFPLLASCAPWMSWACVAPRFQKHRTCGFDHFSD